MILPSNILYKTLSKNAGLVLVPLKVNSNNNCLEIMMSSTLEITVPISIDWTFDTAECKYTIYNK